MLPMGSLGAVQLTRILRTVSFTATILSGGLDAINHIRARVINIMYTYAALLCKQ